MGLQPTEYAALAWLTRQGIAVRHQHRRSPDFIAENGDGYEVKLVRQNSLHFYASQIQSLREHPGCRVLGFEANAADPCLNVSFAELSVPGRHGKFRLSLVDSVCSVSLPRELWQRIDAVAQARRRKRSAVIHEILARHIDEQRPVA